VTERRGDRRKLTTEDVRTRAAEADDGGRRGLGVDDDEVGGPARHAAGAHHVPHRPLQRVVAVVAVVHSDHHHRLLLLRRRRLP